MHFDFQFRARIVSRDIGGGHAQLVATLDDGREFSDVSAYALAKKLRQAGLSAAQVCMPDWREGDIAPGASQRIRVFHCLRLWERGEVPVDDNTLYGSIATREDAGKAATSSWRRRSVRRRPH